MSAKISIISTYISIYLLKNKINIGYSNQCKYIRMTIF